MIEFELDMQALKEHGIKMDYYAFEDVKELVCSSMIACFLMIEMLTLLINTFDRRVPVSRIRTRNNILLMNSHSLSLTTVYPILLQ